MATKEMRRRAGARDIHRLNLEKILSPIEEWVKRLPKEDIRYLYELMFVDLPNAKGGEERDSILNAIMEILEQEPVRVMPLDQTEQPLPGLGLRKWIDFAGRKIKSLRKKAGLTQDQLAEKSGLPQSHISRLEHGEHSPSRVTLEKIASALGVEVSEFDPPA